MGKGSSIIILHAKKRFLCFQNGSIRSKFLKVMNTCLILLSVGHTVEVHKYPTNCRLWKLHPLLPFPCW